MSRSQHATLDRDGPPNSPPECEHPGKCRFMSMGTSVTTGDRHRPVYNRAGNVVPSAAQSTVASTRWVCQECSRGWSELSILE